MTRIVILGGGPAGYEAALVAAQHEADVVLVEEDSVGGNCVAYDCVPSKTFIASAGVRAGFRATADMGIDVDSDEATVDLPRVNARVRDLALAQSADIKAHGAAGRACGCARDVALRGRATSHSATHDIEHRALRRPHRGRHRGRRAHRHRRLTPRAPRRGARRPAHPHLAPDLRPGDAAGAPRRRRLRRHRRRVRVRVRRARCAGHPDLQPGPGAPARGPRRRRHARGGLHRARGDHRAAVPGRQGRRDRGRGAGDALRRSRGRPARTR